MVNSPKQYKLLYTYLFDKIKEYLILIDEWVDLTESEKVSAKEEKDD